MKKYSFWYAVATLVGSTVGVGIFGVPFVFTKAGFLPGILFLVGITIVVVLLNVMYGEVVLRTETKHYLIGYADKYLGPTAKKLLLFTSILSIYGVLLSYVIISGIFLSNFFSFLFFSSPAFFSTVFFVVLAGLVFNGIKIVSKFDFVMLLFFVFVISLIAIFSASHVSMDNFTLVAEDFWFLPFGVIFFAMSGLSGIPLTREVLAFNYAKQDYDSATLYSDREPKFKRIIIFGTVIPAVLYLIFTIAVVGVSGDATSTDAISGLAFFLGQKIIIIGSLFGVLAISTSFLGLGIAMKESFQFDLHFSRRKAWLLVVVPPYLLFSLGVRNFIDVIGLVGGLALSLEGIFLLFLYMKARKKGDRVPEYSINIPQFVIYFLIAVFTFAAVYTLLT